MAFSADELRVLRRALAKALHPTPPAAAPTDETTGWAEDVQEYVRLAESVEDAVRESGRLQAFLLADLRRYRAALPGAAPGYLERLGEAIDSGYVPDPDDLSALRGLRALPCSPAEHQRRSALLRRCSDLAERDVRVRLGPRSRRPVALPRGPLLGGAGSRRARPALDVLFPVPSASSDQERPQPPAKRPDEKRPPQKQPSEKRPPEKEKKPHEGEPGEREQEPAKPAPPAEPEKPGTAPRTPEGEPRRRMPTPAEVWPPHRRRRGQPPSSPGSGKPTQRLVLATG